MSEVKKTESGEVYQLSGKEVCAALVMFVGLKNEDPATSAIHSVGAEGYKYSWRSTEFGAELVVQRMDNDQPKRTLWNSHENGLFNPQSKD